MGLSKKNKIIITRVLGSLIFVVGLAVFGWNQFGTQKLDANQRALANIARMEAAAKAGVFNTKISDVQNGGSFLQQVRDVQKSNIKNITFVAMAFGVILLYFGFTMKHED